MADANDTLRTKLQQAAGTMPQRELAAILGLGQGHVSEILSGRKRMGIKVLMAIRLNFPAMEPYVMAAMNAAASRTRRKRSKVA